MRTEITPIIEAVLVNLAFAQAELALSEEQTAGVLRAFEHIKSAIADLSVLAPSFVRLDEEAA